MLYNNNIGFRTKRVGSGSSACLRYPPCATRLRSVPCGNVCSRRRRPVEALRSSRLQDHEILLGCPSNSLKRNPPIKRHESTVVPHGEAEKVYVRDLSGTMNSRRIEYRGIEKTRLIRPELVHTLPASLGQSCDEQVNGLRVGIRGTRHDAHAAVLGQRAGSPTLRRVPRKPRHSRLVGNMVRIKQRDQDVDVK